LTLPQKRLKPQKGKTKTTFSHMIAAERQQVILEQAHSKGTVRTSDLAQLFEVSEETIRRDLDKLTDTGHLARTHGGATTSELQRIETDHHQREAQNLDEKVSIARKAATLIKPGDTILLDASSTALQLVDAIAEIKDVHVVTYSQEVSELLVRRTYSQLTLLGGTFDQPTRSYCGMLTESALRHIRIDRFFFSCKGVDPTSGLSEANNEQARLKKAILEHSEVSYLLADHSKIGLRSNYFFSPLEKIPTLITDSGISTSALSLLEQSPTEILIS